MLISQQPYEIYSPLVRAVAPTRPNLVYQTGLPMHAQPELGLYEPEADLPVGHHL